jgi:hypothetical protein
MVVCFSPFYPPFKPEAPEHGFVSTQSVCERTEVTILVSVHINEGRKSGDVTAGRKGA